MCGQITAKELRENDTEDTEKTYGIKEGINIIIDEYHSMKDFIVEKSLTKDYVDFKKKQYQEIAERFKL